MSKVCLKSICSSKPTMAQINKTAALFSLPKVFGSAVYTCVLSRHGNLSYPFLFLNDGQAKQTTHFFCQERCYSWPFCQGSTSTAKPKPGLVNCKWRRILHFWTILPGSLVALTPKEQLWPSWLSCPTNLLLESCDELWNWETRCCWTNACKSGICAQCEKVFCLLSRPNCAGHGRHQRTFWQGSVQCCTGMKWGKLQNYRCSGWAGSRSGCTPAWCCE